MTKYLFLSLFLFAGILQNLSAQSSYKLNIERENECISQCAIATDNNEVIAVVNSYGTENGRSELIRIDESGKIIDSVVFSAMPDRFYRIVQIGTSLQTGRYIGLGWQWDDSGESRYLWLFEFDDDFIVHWEQFVDTLEYAPHLSHYRHWNNHYFIGVTIRT